MRLSLKSIGHIGALLCATFVLAGCGDNPLSNFFRGPLFYEFTPDHEMSPVYSSEVFPDAEGKRIARLIVKKKYRQLEEAVKNPALVNIKGKFGITPLWLAVRLQDREAVRILLSAEAEINVEIDWVHTIVCQAAEGDSEILKMLLDAGGDPNMPTSAGASHQGRPLHRAVLVGSKKNIDLLLNAGADINGGDESGSPALESCDVVGALDIFLYLLERGADPTIGQGFDLTAVDSLMWRVHDERDQIKRNQIFQWLWEHGYDPESLAKKIININAQAEHIPDADKAETILAEWKKTRGSKSKDGPPLFYRTTPDNRTYRVYAKDIFSEESGQRAVQLLLQGNYTELKTAVADKTLVNLKGMRGINLLWIAVRIQDAQAVRILLDAGSDVDAEIEGVESAVCTAAGGDSAILKMLLDAGGNPSLRSGSKIQIVPLQAAALLGLQTNIDILLKAGADINGRDSEGNTALFAAERGSWPTFLYLLQRGADPSLENMAGDNPVNRLMSRYGPLDEDEPMRTEILNWLEDHGYDPLKLAADAIRAHAQNRSYEFSKHNTAGGILEKWEKTREEKGLNP